MEFKTRQKIFLIIEAFLSALSLQQESLQPVRWEYTVDIPVLKYFFALTEHVSGFGIENAAWLLGIAVVFFYTRKELQLQKNRYLSVCAACFGICTVFGRSYSEIGSWEYVFGSKAQFATALLVMAGYYFVYKNGIILCLSLMKKTEGGKITRFVFEKHPFGIPFAVFALAGIPYLICFFPGTMEWDSFSQIGAYYNLQGSAAHYPLVSTVLMGKCMDLGRMLFHSDTWGIFIYTGPQYVIQWLVFSYCIYVMGGGNEEDTRVDEVVFSFVFSVLSPVADMGLYAV